VGGRQNGQLEGCLLVGLFEGGVHAPGIRRLELGVQVDLAIGVDETVQSLTGAGVAADGVDDDRVVALRKILQRQPIAVELVYGKRIAVEGGGTDLIRDHVQVGRPAP
jgi:3-deoxy-D-manno-octulosonic acid (KDO) 8-phosphate synthase